MRGSSVPRNATYSNPSRRSALRAAATSAGAGGRNTAGSTPCGTTSTRSGSACTTRVSSRPVARLGTMQRVARRAASHEAAWKNPALPAVCSRLAVKKVASCNVTQTGTRARTGKV